MRGCHVMKHFEKFVYFFEEINIQDPQIKSLFGNKSWNCAKLFQEYENGLSIEPAPWGFAVTTTAYRKFLLENHLPTKIEQILLDVQLGDISLSDAEKSILDLFLVLDIPKDILIQIKASNDTMEENLEDTTFKRIPRSDCNIGEDSKEKAGAGKHNSFPGQRSFSELILSIKKVWASTFTSIAISDFLGEITPEGHLLHLEADMAVPVLVEVDSEKGGAFIAFSTFLGIIRIDFLPNAHGELLVGGKAIPNTVYINGKNLDTDKDPILSVSIPDSTEFGLTRDEIIAYAKRVYKRHLANGPVDTEAAMGADRVIYSVQIRPNVSNIRILENKAITVYEIKKSEVNEDLLLAKGSSVADMCAIGELFKLDNLSDLGSIDLSDKIVLFEEAAPELTILASLSEDIKPEGLITKEGTKLGHLAINLDDNLPTIVGCGGYDSLLAKVGEYVTILHGNVYQGIHPKAFEKVQLDLNLPELKSVTKAQLVASNPAMVERYAAYPHDGYALIRQESLQNFTMVNGKFPLPPILSCIHHQYVDNEEILKNIEEMIAGNSVTGPFDSPVDAYVYHISRSMIPFVLDAESKNSECALRAYGGRVCEDNPYLGKYLPDQAYEMIGQDGARMYLQNWGLEVLVTYAKIWLALWNLGARNVPVFIPNVANIEEWRYIKAILESHGIPIDRDKRFGSYKVMVAVECPSAIFSIQEFFADGVDGGSFAFNDIRQSMELFNRNHSWLGNNPILPLTDPRGNLDSAPYFRLMNLACNLSSEVGFELSTCGIPSPEMILLLVKRGIKAIGFNPGKKFVDGYMAIYNAIQ